MNLSAFISDFGVLFYCLRSCSKYMNDLEYISVNVKDLIC